MRIMVFFDLPTKTKKQRKAYTKFRAFLLDDGYDMLQYSVYVRVCKGADAVETHRRRIQNYLPKKGSVHFLVLTEGYYERMEILVGNLTEQEEIGNKQLLLF